MDDVLFFDVVLEEWRCEFLLKLFDNAVVETGGGFELVEFLLQFFGLKDVLVVGWVGKRLNLWCDFWHWFLAIAQR